MWFFVSKDLRRSYSRPTTVPFATVSKVSLLDDCEYVCTLPAIIPYARIVASSMERLGPTSPKTTSPVAFRIWCCDLSAEWWLIGEGTMRERVSPYPLPIASTGFHNACKRQVRVCTVSTVWLLRVSVCSMWLFLVCVPLPLTCHLALSTRTRAFRRLLSMESKKGSARKEPHAVSTKMRLNVENQRARSHLRACLLVYRVCRVQLRVPVRHRRLLYLRHKTHLEQESTQRPVKRRTK